MATPSGFEILLRTGAKETQQIVDIYRSSLERMGIEVSVRSVDSAEYKERTDVFDFDMTWYRSRPLALARK